MKKIFFKVKYLSQYYLTTLIVITSNNSCRLVTKSDNVSPFLGSKNFETRRGIAGTGTPIFTVNIDSNDNVSFTLLQISAHDHITDYADTFNAGKYRNLVFCNLAWDEFPRWYIIKKDSVIEVDSSGHRLLLNECCGLLDTNQKVCPCADIYE